MGYALFLTCVWSAVGAFVLSQGAGEPTTTHAFMLACVWSVVGALVFFVRVNISLTERVLLTIGTSVAFGIIGWVHLSNMADSAHSVPTIAKESSQVDQPSPRANSLPPSR